ncbi:MAG: alanine:cation symporter family protein [Alphaproteobacteria bacterium]|nr:alanine:cation symporter family protein [Alphaproteobacteria bacterium]
MSIDQTINQAFQPVSEAVASIIFYAEPWSGHDIKLILVWLVLASLFLTFYFGFINIRYFKHGIDLIRGKYDKKGQEKGEGKGKDEEGQINRFQALATSLSGTVGLGNIAGVAVAVSAGGPGAVFWMAMMGIFGMSAKFAEAALGVKYRHHTDPERPERISGGPMYYLKAAFEGLNMPVVGSVLAAFFALCCIGGAIGAGNMFQANQAFQQVVNVFGGEEGFWADKGWLFGLILAVLVGSVIIGGLKSIAAVASKIVPFMGGLYLLAGLVVIALNYQNIPSGFATIFELALTPEAGFGAVIGALLIGVQRAAFSNEAGIGSAAIVHATAKTNDQVSQGFVGMLGPFIDTIVICMVTALVIVMTGAYEGTSGMEGVSLTSRAFESVFPWFPYVLALTVFLFAYSTMIAWFYYGLKCLTYLTGDKPVIELGFKVIYCAFVVVGAASALDHIILFSDSMIFAMAIPNIIGLYLLAPSLKQDIKKYIQSIDKK